VRQDGKIFRPEPVAASSLRYSAVAYSYLPLDADLLGIDPVRLPSDGRVPIFRPGGFAVVGHTGRSPPRSATARPSTVAGAPVACARGRPRRRGDPHWLHHRSGSRHRHLHNVTGYSQPVTIEHRIEDMAVVRDVQINGEISFTRADPRLSACHR
jgi:hypothetical protein